MVQVSMLLLFLLYSGYVQNLKDEQAFKKQTGNKNKRTIRTYGICTIKTIKKPVNCVLVDDCVYGIRCHSVLCIQLYHVIWIYGCYGLFIWHGIYNFRYIFLQMVVDSSVALENRNDRKRTFFLFYLCRYLLRAVISWFT